jgi:hypothetical protein
MILVIAKTDDQSADLVCAALADRGAPFVRLDYGRFPSEAALSVAIGPDAGLEASLAGPDGHRFDFHQIHAVWLRSIRDPRPSDHVNDKVARAYVTADSKELFQDLWATLELPWLPGRPADVAAAQRKIGQLHRAQAMGLSLPDTLVSNDARAIREFHRRHDGAIVSKLLATGFMTATKGRHTRYTERVTARDLDDAESLRSAPMIYQAFVPKKLEVRATVVGERVFAAAIHSQATNRTRLDWRRYDRGRTPMDVHVLPTEIEECLLRLCRSYRLCYGAIDLILTPDGRYVFLELNPTGQFQWIESETGLAISDGIADELIRSSIAREPADARDARSSSTTHLHS